MTNFANDLIRYLETTDGYTESTLANDFFFEEVDYWDDFKPEGWDHMNISFEFVEHYGGEDQGSDYWTVYKFTDNNTGEEVYIKFDGWYASYEGATYENCFVVQPKEKTVVVYE